MTGEAYTIREVGEPEVVRIAAFFSRNAYKKVTEEYLRRKYFENPAGRGRIFVMEDEGNEIMGTLGYMPHLLVTPQEPPLVVMESVDLFIAPEARGKKMFPRLQGSVMKRIGYPLIAFPNKRSERITIELGWERFSSIENWVCPVGSFWVPRKGFRDLLLCGLWGVLRVYSFFRLAGTERSQPSNSRSVRTALRSTAPSFEDGSNPGAPELEIREQPGAIVYASPVRNCRRGCRIRRYQSPGGCGFRL